MILTWRCRWCRSHGSHNARNRGRGLRHYLRLSRGRGNRRNAGCGGRDNLRNCGLKCARLKL